MGEWRAVGGAGAGAQDWGNVGRAGLDVWGLQGKKPGGGGWVDMP